MIAGLSTLRALVLAAAGLLALATGPVVAQPGQTVEPISSEGLREAATNIAQELVSQFADRFNRATPRMFVAVQPIGDEAPGLPADVRARITREIEIAISRAGRQRFDVVPRESLMEVWRTQADFSNADIRERLRQANAQIQVIGVAEVSGNQLELSYRAYDVRASETTAVIATALPQQVRIDPRALETRDFAPAIADAARALAAQISRGTVARGEPVLQQTGRSDPLGNEALDRLFQQLRDILPRERVRAAGQQSITGGDGEPAPAPTDVRIEAVVRPDGDRFQITFSATVGGDVRPIAVRAVNVWAASVPENARTPVAVAAGGRFSAEAEAAIVPPFDEASAVRAARALARARVVAQAQGRPLANAPSSVRDTAEATWALQALAGGITADERWAPVKAQDRSVRVSLEARVVSLDRGAGLDLKASMPMARVKAGAPFTLQISTAEAASVAVFGWIADDTLVRLYPYGRQRDLRTTGRGPLVLPRDNEPPFMSEPRPGVPEDFEALVVIASKAPLPYDRLAREVGATVEETMANARPVQDFLRELATLAARPDASVALKVVPYTVYNP